MPTATLSRRETFSASHRLHCNGMSDEDNRKLFGKCNHANGHGHNYVLEVLVRGEIDQTTGLVMNLSDLKALIHEHVLDKIDHKHMNLDVAEFSILNPTTENVAKVIWDWLHPHLGGLLHEVRLHETENNIAIDRG
ncbi:MAG: 6-carboxytetrahydropterin synthase [Alphaproteobacteria bacterium]